MSESALPEAAGSRDARSSGLRNPRCRRSTDQRRRHSDSDSRSPCARFRRVLQRHSLRHTQPHRPYHRRTAGSSCGERTRARRHRRRDFGGAPHRVFGFVSRVAFPHTASLAMKSTWVGPDRRRSLRSPVESSAARIGATEASLLNDDLDRKDSPVCGAVFRDDEHTAFGA